MAKIDIASEIITRHTDAELVEYMYRTTVGVLKNYKTALEQKDPNILWVNVSDIEMVGSILKAMNKREQEKLANRPE